MQKLPPIIDSSSTNHYDIKHCEVFTEIEGKVPGPKTNEEYGAGKRTEEIEKQEELL